MTPREILEEMLLATDNWSVQLQEGKFPQCCEAIATAVRFALDKKMAQDEAGLFHDYWCCVLTSRYPGSWEQWRAPGAWGEVDSRIETLQRRLVLVSQGWASKDELEDVCVFVPALRIIAKQVLGSPRLAGMELAAQPALPIHLNEVQRARAGQLGLRLVIGAKT